MTCFGDPQAYAVELGAAPKKVESVINYRVDQRRAHRGRRQRRRARAAGRAGRAAGDRGGKLPNLANAAPAKRPGRCTANAGGGIERGPPPLRERAGVRGAAIDHAILFVRCYRLGPGLRLGW